jgi:hypothetical protein
MRALHSIAHCETYILAHVHIIHHENGNAIYAKMFEQVQHVTGTNPERQSYTVRLMTDQGCKT